MVTTAIVFLAGIGTGWLIGNYRLSAAIHISRALGGTASGRPGAAQEVQDGNPVSVRFTIEV